MPTPTHSGYQRLIWNFRERVVSDDFNRALQFLARQDAELLRRLHAASASEDEAGGKTTVADAVANPARGVVFEGLRARPEIGTTNLFVEPGIALLVSPHADPHPADSPARVVIDPGVQAAGALVLTAGGGGTRIDVVECQVADTVTEADNRDIFDPSTGLFAPALVNKVARGSLAYRIRLGVPGAGFPGTASGWLPLAVCSVPAAAVTWDDVTVWDVRPLLSDLARPPHLLATTNPIAGQRHVSAVEPTTAPGEWRARGLVELELAGWRIGGNLASSTSGVSYLRLDALDPAVTVQEPGFAAVADRPWFLYLAQPFGLPRWAKYTPTSVGGERRPGSLRGIPVFSQRAPLGLSPLLNPASPLPLPTNTGLGGTTTNAVVALAGMFDGAFFAPATNGDQTNISLATGHAPTAGAGTVSPVFTLTGGMNFPACVSAIKLQFEMTITLAAGTTTAFDRDVQLKDAAGAETYSYARLTNTATSPGAGSWVDRFEVWLQLPPNLPTGAPVAFRLEVDYTVAGVLSLQRAYVKGWKLP